MSYGLKYSAFSYLNDWYYYDKRFYTALNATENDIDTFYEAAKYYRVTRNFKVTQEAIRLSAAFALVRGISGPVNEDSVGDKVNELADSFERSRYGKRNLSAASKFLWLRFRTPVILLDTQAAKWLQKKGEPRLSNQFDYRTYTDAWRQNFTSREREINNVCSQLLAVKTFSVAENEPDESVNETISQQWFHERVFDKFLWLNGGSL